MRASCRSPMCSWSQARALAPDEIRDFAQAHIPERAAAPKEIVIVDKIPLTDVGKPAKVQLRNDAARRAFQALLADVMERPADLMVDMVADPIKGSVARIRIATASTPARGDIEARIHERMKAFPIAYVVQWTEPVGNP